MRKGIAQHVTEHAMISLTRREFDAVSSKLLEACFEAVRRDRPATARARQRPKTIASAKSAPRPIRRAVAAVH